MSSVAGTARSRTRSDSAASRPFLGEHLGERAVRDAAEPPEGIAQLVAPHLDLTGIAVPAAQASQFEVEGRADEMLLGAVVQVSFDAMALRIRARHGLPLGALLLQQMCACQGGEPAVRQGQPPARGESSPRLISRHSRGRSGAPPVLHCRRARSCDAEGASSAGSPCASTHPPPGRAKDTDRAASVEGPDAPPARSSMSASIATRVRRARNSVRLMMPETAVTGSGASTTASPAGIIVPSGPHDPAKLSTATAPIAHMRNRSTGTAARLGIGSKPDDGERRQPPGPPRRRRPGRWKR